MALGWSSRVCIFNVLPGGTDGGSIFSGTGKESEVLLRHFLHQGCYLSSQSQTPNAVGSRELHAG